VTFKIPERDRITRLIAAAMPGQAMKLASSPEDGRNGAFYLDGPCGKKLLCIASDGEEWEAAGLKGIPWEHVSVSTSSRPPNWEEMVFVKDLFWDAEDCVVQFHPPRSDYVNCHPYVLHLWRPIGVELPRPDSFAVGPRV